MIFCDMDGVLTDFDGSFEARFGMPPKALPRPELWEKVLNTKDYWYDLPKKRHMVLTRRKKKNAFGLKNIITKNKTSFVV